MEKYSIWWVWKRQWFKSSYWFLTSFSKLRAKNYSIENCDRNLVKFISDKIIPAKSTTTATICCYIISQIYIIIRNNYSRDNIRTLNFYLSLPNFRIKKFTKLIMIRNKKTEKMKTEIKVPYVFTVWDKIEIQGSLTSVKLNNELVQKFGFEFEFDGLYIIDDVALVKEENDMEKLIEELYFSKFPTEITNNILLEEIGINKIDHFKIIYLKYDGQIDDYVNLQIPIIKYR